MLKETTKICISKAATILNGAKTGFARRILRELIENESPLTTDELKASIQYMKPSEINIGINALKGARLIQVEQYGQIVTYAPLYSRIRKLNDFTHQIIR